MLRLKLQQNVSIRGELATFLIVIRQLTRSNLREGGTHLGGGQAGLPPGAE